MESTTSPLRRDNWGPERWICHRTLGPSKPRSPDIWSRVFAHSYHTCLMSCIHGTGRLREKSPHPRGPQLRPVPTEFHPAHDLPPSVPVGDSLFMDAACPGSSLPGCLPYGLQTCLDSPRNASLFISRRGKFGDPDGGDEVCMEWDARPGFWTTPPHSQRIPFFGFISIRNVSLILM